MVTLGNIQQQGIRRFGLLLAGTAAIVLLHWTWPLQAWFLPGNALLTLHVAEVGLLALLALDLGVRFYHGRRPHLVLRTLQGQTVGVGKSLVLGSRPGAGGVTLPGPQVSRRHLEIRRTSEGRLAAIDLGSTNGSFLRGEDLRERGVTVLAAGDRLQLGRGGPELTCEAAPAPGLLGGKAQVIAWLGLLWCGLYLGWRANGQRLTADLAAGSTVVDFSVFLDPWPVLFVGAAASATGLAYFLGRRRHGAAAEAGTAFLVLLALGLVVLYPLLPAVARHYGAAAQRAVERVEAKAGEGSWRKLEAWERAGGRPRHAIEALRRDEPTSGLPGAGLPELGLDREEQIGVLQRYESGRRDLRLATNLAAAQGETFYAVTYFRQAMIVLAAVVVGLVGPLWIGGARRGARRVVEGLVRPISRRLVRAADHGSELARLLRPVAYWDIVCGVAAAAVVALTLTVGTDLGRGRTLYLDLPGLPPVQSVELVKALFVLFMAGYFARQGPHLARSPRRRYFVPFLVAVLGALALTGLQGDMGGLIMLGLLVGLVFVAATGHLRVILYVPLLVLPGWVLAAGAGLTGTVTRRLDIWSTPRLHGEGEQIVQARQLLLSSGWSGHPPHRLLAGALPDVQGDLVFAALAERFGMLGLAAVVLCWLVLVASLLRVARQRRGSASILLAGTAALFLVQSLTQAGGAMGLLPLTGVPLPWLSHGLTASLIFTAFFALAMAVAGGDEAPGRDDGEHRSEHLRYLQWANALAALALVGLSLYWTLLLPSSGRFGPLGRDYRWQDVARRDLYESWIEAGLFQPVARRGRLELSEAARSSGVPRAELAIVAEGLRHHRETETTELLPYLYSNPNRFARRLVPRGSVLSWDGVALAENLDGRRVHPLGESAFHPLGYGGGLAQPLGVEGGARDLLGVADLGDLELEGLRRTAWRHDVHHGFDLKLTLHSELQKKAYEELAGRRGAVVVLDLRVDELRVLVSSPAVDPDAAGAEDWRGYVLREDAPLRNRAVASTESYSPPGSVFKIVVAAALLEGGAAPRSFLCRGRDRELRISCSHGAHGRVDLKKALVVSCNLYFAHAAVELGAERIREVAARFGFNPKTPSNLLGTVPGGAQLLVEPSRVDAASDLNDRDLARVGYGQGPVNATPLQVARLGAVVATGGELVEPSLAHALELSRRGEDEDPVWSWKSIPAPRRRAIRRSTADALNEALRGVFKAGGTGGRLARLWWGEQRWRLAEKPGDEPAWRRQGYARVAVAGKTGSAWKTRRDRVDDAWMVVWAPADVPSVLVAVLVEDAGEGGKVAGPVAMRLLRDTLEVSGYEP